MRRSRLCSGMEVMFSLPMRMVPSSMGMEPQMMLSSEVLPEPLEPTTQTNCFSGMEREKSLNRHVSFTVPP